MGAEMAAGLLSRVRRLPPRERALLAAAWLALAVIPLALCLVPFRRLRDWAEGEATSRRFAGPPTPERVAALVEAAAQHHFVPTMCLARALVLCRLLRHMVMQPGSSLGARGESACAGRAPSRRMRGSPATASS